MAIGDFNSGNNQSNKENKEATYYSRLKFNNASTTKSLKITFWGGLMIISMEELNKNDSGSFNRSNNQPLEVIRLSINKAKILYNQLVDFKAYIEDEKSKIDPNMAFGCTSGLGKDLPYIGFSAVEVKDDGETRRMPICTMGKIDNDGNIVSSHTFEFDNTSYLYGLNWSDISKMEAEKTMYPLLELDTLMDALRNFYENMSGAAGYSLLDLARYELNKNNRRFDDIYDKLGIQRIQQKQYQNQSSNNFLNNLASKNSTSTSFDNLEDLLE